MKKWIKYILLLILAFLLAAAIGILSYDQRTTKNEWKSKFSKEGIPLRLLEGNQMTGYATGSVSSDHAIVFIHGAPGDASQFQSYLMDSTLRSNYHMLAIDRPGYGNSMYGKAMISIAEQAKVLHSFLEKNTENNQKITLISHSYGGPIAAYMGILRPERYHAHLMLCPVMDPDSEPMFWFADVPLWWPLKYISSGAMKVAAFEKITHISELQKHLYEWKKNTVPTTMVQGAKDWLAPIENAEFVKNHFPTEVTLIIIEEEESHFIPFTEHDWVIELIQKVMK